jgi:nucleoside-diphosphate-sugar epimerase
MTNTANMILVTGATGYVGRRLIRMLAETYGASNILSLAYDQADNELERTGRANLDALGVRWIPVDLVSGRGLEMVPKSPRMVFHLASNTDTGATDHSINDVGTRNLLAAVQPLSPEAHFIFTSTIAVADHRDDDSKPVSEETPLLRPFNDYGRRKLAAEEFLRERSRVDGFRSTIVRLCAVYGRGTRGDGLFDRLSHMVAADSLLARFNYPGKLSFINVEDIARILVLLSGRPTRSGSSELYIPVAEVMTISQLIECYYHAFKIDYRPIRFPSLFWRACDLVAKFSYRLEPILPHVINNRIWQLGLVVGSGFHNESRKIFYSFPELKLKRFEDVVCEMIR